MIPIREHFVYPQSNHVLYPDVGYPTYELIRLEDGRGYIVGIPEGKKLPHPIRIPEYSKHELHYPHRTDAKYLNLRSLAVLVQAIETAQAVFIDNESWIPLTDSTGGFGGLTCQNELSTELMWDFVKQHGFPGTVVTLFEERPAYQPGVLDLPTATIAGVSLVGVAESLFFLWIVYLCWCYLEWGERGKFEQIIKTYGDWFSYKDRPFPEKCRRIIGGEGEVGGYGLASIVFRYHGAALLGEVRCESLFGALSYQLFTLISIGEAAREGCIAAYCSHCGQQYLKKHGNSSLCDECKTPKAKSKAFRDKMKAVKKEV